MTDFTASLAALQNAIAIVSKKHGLAAATELEVRAQHLLGWLGYLEANVSNEVADELLDSVRSAIVETTACLSIGFARPAIYAIRLQMELAPAWLYFNDHPMEWRYVKFKEQDFPLRSQNMKYLSTYVSKFKSRFKMLEEVKTRTVEEPYELLSIHVHGTSHSLTLAYKTLSDVVQEISIVNEAIELQHSVSEYLCDVFAARFADQWHDLPTELKDPIIDRLGGEGMKKLCA